MITARRIRSPLSHFCPRSEARSQSLRVNANFSDPCAQFLSDTPTLLKRTEGGQTSSGCLPAPQSAGESETFVLAATTEDGEAANGDQERRDDGK